MSQSKFEQDRYLFVKEFIDPNLATLFTSYSLYNNKHRHKFDPGKWDWCPDNNDFICTKSITPDMVKHSIDNVIKKLNA